MSYYFMALLWELWGKSQEPLVRIPSRSSTYWTQTVWTKSNIQRDFYETIQLWMLWLWRFQNCEPLLKCIKCYRSTLYTSFFVIFYCRDWFWFRRKRLSRLIGRYVVLVHDQVYEIGMVLWQTDPLLGKDREANNGTNAVARQRSARQ
jgi:hypothetical protein